MISLSAIFVAITAIVFSFYNLWVSWTLLLVAAITLSMISIGAKTNKAKPQPSLSMNANAMLQKFAHYYLMPVSGAAFSGAASCMAMAGVVIGVVGLFHGFWLGIGFVIISSILFGWFSRFFNPTRFLVDESERQSHNEVIAFMQNR